MYYTYYEAPLILICTWITGKEYEVTYRVIKAPDSKSETYRCERFIARKSSVFVYSSQKKSALYEEMLQRHSRDLDEKQREAEEASLGD